jgi:signal transduction histidine kinase
MKTPWLQRNPYRLTVGFKASLFVGAILIIFAVLFYTQHILEQLRDNSRRIVRVYAQMISRIGQEDPEAEYNFIFDEVIRRIDFPIINTDRDGNPLSWRNLEGIPADSNVDAYLDEVHAQMAAMDRENDPLPIQYDTTILGYIHYDTDTPLIRELRWLPFIEIGVVAAFILIGYIGFSNIKRSEQRSIWVGMAKETAHQLGTPLSSMMGWVELLKAEADGREKLLRIMTEMEVDLGRIDRVVSRFSQIGSAADLKEQDVVPVISEIVAYFRKRVPQQGKRVVITEEYLNDAHVRINSQLIGWVVENVLKNAMDAIDHGDGLIQLSMSRQNGVVALDVRDNGKGIELKNRDQIFRPGYSTKKRGWGLGLSLARRIIEDYHGGKIFVKDSKAGSGTTIRIQLKEA